MKIHEWNLMNVLSQSPYINQRDLSEKTGYSLGKVNQMLSVLVKEGLLNEGYSPAPSALRLMKERKPCNAVILAAGYGMRMAPINREVPKGLLEVHGEPLAERLVRQLMDAGIHDIFMVTGYMKEHYEYLIDKYQVSLIVNKEYDRKNNLHSLCLAEEALGNTYIVPCDIWCKYNPFSDREWYSWYMVSDQPDEESRIRVNRKQELVTVKEGISGNTMVGIAYLLKKDADTLKQRLRQLDAQKKYENAFWEEALLQNHKMFIQAHIMPAPDVVEINTFEQLRVLDEQSRQLDSKIIRRISEVLGCQSDEIIGIQTLKKGMTNRSFRFCCRGAMYIMRIPGEGTGKIINREQEYQVYQAIDGLHLSDVVRYFDAANGYKLTEFIESSRVCNPKDWSDVRKCMQVLRKFHNQKIKVDHTFDLFERIEQYESLWEGRKSCFKDYLEVKQRICELKDYIERQPKEYILCHIDAVPDNFIFTGEGPRESVRLIDWEYAGMQDPHADIAMFAVYAMYGRTDVDQLIDAYFPEGCPHAVRIKIYCYIAVCGLVWSNWCEYKRLQGVEFGEYSLRQYRFAKEYYKYVKKEWEIQGV